MSMQQPEFRIHIEGEDDVKTYQDPSEFESTRSMLKDRGIEFDAEIPEWYDVEDQEATVIDTNGHSENGDKPDQQEAESQEPKEPEVVDEEPPERDITDDPIEWLNRTAGDFVDNIQGTQAINKKGYRVLQYWYDIDTDSEVEVGPEETGFEYCRVKATAEMPDGQTAIAHGSAHVDRGDDKTILLEMADTRAKSRALSDITGVGAVAVAELKGLDHE